MKYEEWLYLQQIVVKIATKSRGCVFEYFGILQRL